MNKDKNNKFNVTGGVLPPSKLKKKGVTPAPLVKKDNKKKKK